MKRSLRVWNRQRTRPVDTRWLRTVLRTALDDLLAVAEYEVGIHLVADREMIRLHEQFLHDPATTDVITFDYRTPPPRSVRAPAADRAALHGECFVCVDEAVRQAPRFRTRWRAELVRYAVHGLLHLSGWNDQAPAQRRRMKTVENRIVRVLTRQFKLAQDPHTHA